MNLNRKLLTCVLLSLVSCQPKLDLGPIPIGGNFLYEDRSGKKVSLSDYPEPVLLVFFGYTQCPDFCPNMLSKIKLAQGMLDKDLSNSFRTIFISIDPSRDGSDVVQKYVSFYLQNATGLSFNESTTALLVKQYGAYVEKSTDKDTIDHSTYVYVLDKERKTRVLLKSNDSAEQFATVIKALSGDSVQSQ
ncbi:MAG: SCO family protein [Leptospira sp.]|nr:SCO family protein [Leptospira sp.]